MFYKVNLNFIFYYRCLLNNILDYKFLIKINKKYK